MLILNIHRIAFPQSMSAQCCNSCRNQSLNLHCKLMTSFYVKWNTRLRWVNDLEIRTCLVLNYWAEYRRGIRYWLVMLEVHYTYSCISNITREILARLKSRRSLIKLLVVTCNMWSETLSRVEYHSDKISSREESYT